jgi:hypothetical protein
MGSSYLNNIVIAMVPIFIYRIGSRLFLARHIQGKLQLFSTVFRVLFFNFSYSVSAGSNSQKGQGHGKSQGDTHTSLGSSLYYGGPDLCCDPSTTTTEGLLGVSTGSMNLC